MEDQSLFSSSQPKAISEGLQNFINAMVEEIVLEGKPFDSQKKYLKKFSENEGLDYEKLEADITTFIEILDSMKNAPNKLLEKYAVEKAKECHLSKETVEMIVIHKQKHLKTLIITDMISTGLDSDFGSIKSLEIDEQPFAGGAHGTLYHCRGKIGKSFKNPQVIKIFKDGNAEGSYDTIKKLQDGLIRKKAEFDKLNVDFLTNYPALLAVPQFVFEGELDGVPVKGYSANDLKQYGYKNFDEVILDENVAEIYDKVNLANKFAKAYHMMRAFALLNELHYIRADISFYDLFVSLENDGGCVIIDFDSGAVNKELEEDIPMRFHDMLAPELRRQFKESRHARANLYSESWSVAVACFYLLSGVHPFSFLTDCSDTAMSEYNSRFTWPKVKDGCPGFDRDVAEYIKSVCDVLPSDVLACFRQTFANGYTNPYVRTPIDQWCVKLKPYLPSGLL